FIESGDSQDLLEKYNMAGRVKEFSGDYLYISNANVGRDKANLYVKQSATYEVSNKEDNLTTKLKVSYQNTGDFNSVLNKGYKDFVQIFVPKGAVIVKSQGLKDFVGNGEEFGKTVFSGLIEVAPKTSAEFSLEYTLPKSASTTDGYKLLIQKQPGLNDSSYKVIIDGKSQEFVLEKDKEIIF
ncbi:hypothetical protein L6255_03725, partial [Candidatus Parcubacteria bacterium]|nr:hypothetical protein [Candidatus Parcubacteria bacterium]